jgi:FG-GAP-like repeat
MTQSRGLRPSLPFSAGVLLLALGSCDAAGVSEPDAGEQLFAHAPGSPMPIRGGVVLIGDMNGDGNPDLVVGSGRSITVWLCNGAESRTAESRSGPFRPTAASTVQVPDPVSEMALGDVNGDGNLDVAVANHDSYNVALLMGDGKGALALAPSSPIVMRDGQQPHTHDLAIGDLNGDGKLDIMTVNNAHNDVSIVSGDGRGGFSRAPGSPFPVGPSPYPGALGDVNGDGRLDIVATASATGPARAQQLPLSRALTLLLADEHGGFRPSQLPLRTGTPWFAAIGDLNADGKPEIVATHHEQHALTVLLGDGRGGFAEATGSPFDFGHDVFHIAIVDANRDGKPDVVAVTGDTVRVMLGDGRGAFRTSPHPGPAVGRAAWRMTTGDMNRDGKLDVVTSNDDSVSVLLGQ